MEETDEKLILISVVIPVYNVEDYLSRCINSILQQSYTNIEVILIDDGSIDSSGDICDKFAAIDKRIKVYHKTNGGVSSARNLGIEKAAGDYICFVDSDDWVDIDYFEQVILLLESKKPIFLKNNYVVDDGAGNVINKYKKSNVLYYDAEQDLYEMANGCHYGWEPFASFYEATACKKVKFNTEIVFGEDLLFRYEFNKANDGLYIYQYLSKYHYYTRESSAVNSYAIYKKVDDLKVLELIMSKANKVTRNILYQKDYLARLITYYRLSKASSDERDLAVSHELFKKIKKEFTSIVFDASISTTLKLKMVACFLPISIIDKMYSMYIYIKGKK